MNDTDEAHQEQSDRHDYTLKEVGPGLGDETTHHRVEQYYAQPDDHTDYWIDIECCGKHLACTDDLGRNVEGKEEYDQQ